MFGIQKSDVLDTKSIFYVELPNAPSDYNQVSFHTDIDMILEPIVPQYEKEWDGLGGTTLDKLEKVIKTVYGKELMKKYGVDESGLCEKYRKKKEEKKRLQEERKRQYDEMKAARQKKQDT